jgi:hypothetical protein
VGLCLYIGASVDWEHKNAYAEGGLPDLAGVWVA